jgi:recombinational DNA repair protein (RecF pathway)
VKKCAFCGSTSNVLYSDPEKGPVCQDCWFKLGQDLEDIEEEKKTPESERTEEKDRRK